MKYTMIWIALLLGSVKEPLFAQLNGDILADKPAVLDAHAFKKEYPDFLKPVSMEVQLSKGNRLLLMSNNYLDSRLVHHPDSLVRQFWNQYGQAVEALPEDTEAVSVHYVAGDTLTMPLRWKKYPAAIREFAMLDNELVRVKSAQDTLRISVRSTGNRQAEAYLLVNNLRDIPLLFDEIKQKTAHLLTALEKKTDPKVLEYSPEVYGRYRADRRVEVANFGSDMIIISPSVSLGYIRGNWMTSLNAEFAFYLEKSPIQPRFGYHHQYFFGRSSEGKTVMYQNGFAEAGLTFFKKDKKNNLDNKGIRQVGQLTVGYQVMRQGNFYEPRTWRISGGFQLTPVLKVEPEVYFHKAFKGLSPGLRFTIGFL